MKDNISFTKIVNFLTKVKDEEDVIITEIKLNNEQMNSLIVDYQELQKYDSSFFNKKDININQISFNWKYGKIKLKRIK